MVSKTLEKVKYLWPTITEIDTKMWQETFSVKVVALVNVAEPPRSFFVERTFYFERQEGGKKYLLNPDNGLFLEDTLGIRHSDNMGHVGRLIQWSIKEFMLKVELGEVSEIQNKRD